MDERRYISVILPLKLEWEPCYYYIPSDQHTTNAAELQLTDIEIGRRVRVKFAGKEYVGVVSAVGIIPDIDEAKIQSILCVETTMEKIRREEILLWRKVAEYYLCTVGEVYKAAYPTSKINLEEARAEARKKAVQRRIKLVELISKRLQTLVDRQTKKDAQLKKSLATGKINKTQVKLEADLARISEDINRTQVEEEDVLSDYAYYYDREKKKLL
jgi:primosomal protein N' (replication factor Y)